MPEIGQEIIFRSIEIVSTGYTGPLTSQFNSVGIGYIIIIGDGLDRMLARLYGRGLQFPMPAVLSRHRQMTHFLRAVLTPIGDCHKEVFAPLSTVLNGKL